MSEMEKILQNWDTADEYLNSKIAEADNKTVEVEEEIADVKKAIEKAEKEIADVKKTADSDLVWFYLDGSKHGLAFALLPPFEIPVVSSYMGTNAVATPITGGILARVYENSSYYLQLRGETGNVSTNKTVYTPGNPLVFTFASTGRWILGIPKYFVKENYVYVTNI